MDESSFIRALADAMKDPKVFREVLQKAARKSSGDLVELHVTRDQRPISVRSCGVLEHPDKEHVTAWEYDTSLRFIVRVNA